MEATVTLNLKDYLALLERDKKNGEDSRKLIKGITTYFKNTPHKDIDLVLTKMNLTIYIENEKFGKGSNEVYVDRDIIYKDIRDGVIK